jgi:hypothetical protein
MAIERDRDTIVTKRRMPLGDHRAAVASTAHRIPLARHTDTLEPHIGGPRKYGAATGGFVANTDDAFHALILFY